MQVGYSCWCDSCFATITAMATTNKSKKIFFMGRHSLLFLILPGIQRMCGRQIRAQRGR